MRDETDRTYVITGASRGIGRGIAEALGREGGTVVVNYRSSEAAAYDVADTITDAGGTAIAVQADVSEFDQVQAMKEHVHETVGPVDVLVNNAGITADRKFSNMTREEWDSVIDVNLGGVFNCTKAFFEDIKQTDAGRLINISSVIGRQGNYGQANYAAAKSGLFGFTRSIALELASSGSTANCVAPGYTSTEMVDEVPEKIQERIRDDIPLDRFADVDDIAAAVSFLASEDTSYVTGEVIDVNGGLDV
ncbi:beta-ketoacyl-ACP reductase [Haloarcula sp. JP-L23]|uniref:beta-ketoacyl-ACP reductase n=1 Tax=Haloarcula sp. JP-L23 TaxID=2716717 RepID=UPI00140EF30E|nr:beta-ketoacyl-ACP reductase [Haloarcula sp. JP-L23]